MATQTPISAAAQKRHQEMFLGHESTLAKTDPEFVALFDNFAFDEVIRESKLSERARFLAILATCLGCGGQDEYRQMLGAALNFELDPVAIKEVLYQATAYVGMARTLPFFAITNEVMQEHAIALPLAPQATTTPKDRVEKGEAKQVELFGDHMKGFATRGPELTVHLNRWLSGNCFGDYYTRTGLSDREREMVTFCYIAAQGGCEPQLTSHAAANLNVGNDEAFMVDVISQCMPYIGYPRTLNAITCLKNAVEQKES